MADVPREQLLRQIEYYFCDLAYPFDEFLQSQADQTGALPIATLAGSPRIVAMLPLLSEAERASLIAETVESGSDSVLVLGDRLKRKYPLPADDPLAPHSVYISGLPKTADEDEIRKLLLDSSRADKFAPILSIRRQRDLMKDRSFSGKAFIELEDEAKASALVACCNNGSVICSKAKILSEFFQSQAASILEVKQKRAQASTSAGVSGTKRPRDDSVSDVRSVAVEPSQRGVVVRFEGVGEGADREAVQAVCSKFGEVRENVCLPEALPLSADRILIHQEASERCISDVIVAVPMLSFMFLQIAYINFSRGDQNGHVRFKSAEVAASAIAALTKDPQEIGGVSPTWSSLSTAEEDTYWQQYHLSLAQRKKPKAYGKGGRGRGKGGRGKGASGS
ncbi:MAG: hypothetical protein SGPRY_010229 [Prymnesium sp.]